MNTSPPVLDQMSLPTRLPMPVEPTLVVNDAGVGEQKVFRAYDPRQTLLLPPDLSEWVELGHLARLVDDLVENVLDLSAIYASYRNLKGAPPYHPKLLLKLLLYGYAVGIFSSRRLERSTWELVPCRYLSADQHPDHWTISEFRRRHLAVIDDLFRQVLQVCQRAQLVKLGHVALDGTKVKANASKHKAMSYGRMEPEEARCAQIVKGWLEEAERQDREEDTLYGEHRGDELPEEFQRTETRLQRLREAKAELEREAKEKAAQQAAENARARGKNKKEIAAAAEAAASKAVPDAKAQRNFTDPDSKIMLNGEKAFVQAYNCQAAVDDSRHKIVLAAGVSNQAADHPHLLPMLVVAALNVDQVPDKISADAGYCGEANLYTLNALGIDAYIAIDKDQHNRELPPPRGRIRKDASLRDRMRRKTRTKKGRAVYARRKHTVEPVFGFIKQGLGFRQFLLRGLHKVDAEWKLVNLGYNLTRLHASGWQPRLPWS